MNKRVQANPDNEWGNIELPGISDDELYNKKWAQVAALKGRKRPDQSERMQGENNPMYGVEHPSKGKSMPQISKKTKGKKKPEGFGEKISRARKGKPVEALQGRKRPDQSKLMSDPTRNKGAAAMKEMHTCPHCGKTANLPNYKRWHGDNCKAR